MNEIKIKVKFKKGLCYSQGINLVTNDYNSTKLVFEFDETEGTKIFEMKDPDDIVVFADEIVNNELILARFDGTNNAYPIFTKAGKYTYEISLYKDNSKLTSAWDSIKVNAEQVVIDGEIVQTYTPMFDNLLSDLSGALQEADNLDIDVSKSGNVATVTVTKKDGTEESVEINDGLKGDKGDKGDTGATGPKGDKGEDAKINGVNTLTIEAGDNITLDQEGNILTINSTGGGSGGTSNYNALTNKPKINNVELVGSKSLNDLGIQPVGNYALESDMIEAQNDIENLQTENERLKATLPTTTGEGQDITLDKTAEMEFVKPPLPRGNSEQESTTGKNLLNSINANTTTINGVTSYRNNGFYYLSGTNTKTDATWILPNTQNTNLPTFEIGQTYTMSFKGTLPSGVYAQLNGVKTSTDTQYSLGSVKNTVPYITFTIDSDYSRTAQLFVGIQATATNVDCNFAIQIEKGSSATSYEPYTGGQPSPRPDYPQEIRNVTGDVEVVVSNADSTKSQTFTFPLGNEKLMIGDYLADDGIHHLKKQIVLNGTENWETGNFGTNSYQLSISGIRYAAYSEDKKILIKSSHFRGVSINNRTASGNNIIYVETSPKIYIRNTTFTSISNFTTWLSTNNVTIEYELVNEEITPYTTEQEQAYNLIVKALSYEEQTNISGSSDENNPIFDVEAYQSTKLILENLDSRLTLVEG